MKTPFGCRPFSGTNNRHGMPRPASRDGIDTSFPDSMTVRFGKGVSPFYHGNQ